MKRSEFMKRSERIEELVNKLNEALGSVDNESNIDILRIPVREVRNELKQMLEDERFEESKDEDEDPLEPDDHHDAQEN